MAATRNHEKSWEKQTVWDMGGGLEVTVGYNQHYGEQVTRIDDAQGYWHCSNGVRTLPERFAFALAWLEPLGLPNSPDEKIMRPKFEKVY